MYRFVSVPCLLLVAACASGGPPEHPHGYGHRDSPGRAYPTALPLPGYDYRFRADPQGLGRDLGPIPEGPHYAEAPPMDAPFDDHADFIREDHAVYERREVYSEVRSYEAYGEVEARHQPPAPYASDAPAYDDAPADGDNAAPYEAQSYEAPLDPPAYRYEAATTQSSGRAYEPAHDAAPLEDAPPPLPVGREVFY